LVTGAPLKVHRFAHNRFLPAVAGRIKLLSRYLLVNRQVNAGRNLVVQHTLALRRANRAGISSRPGLRVGGQKGLSLVFSYFEQSILPLNRPFLSVFHERKSPRYHSLHFGFKRGQPQTAQQKRLPRNDVESGQPLSAVIFRLRALKLLCKRVFRPAPLRACDFLCFC
jgi:hypothetical protein